MCNTVFQIRSETLVQSRRRSAVIIPLLWFRTNEELGLEKGHFAGQFYLFSSRNRIL